MLSTILANKPVLVGLHLGFAILGIDFTIWLLGELVANVRTNKRIKIAAIGSLVSFVLSWLIGGFYYVKFYGVLVKPIIKASSAPWAHSIFMETKEHVFLFVVPLALTLVFLSLLSVDDLKNYNLRKLFMVLTILTASISLLIGAMGFIISASARWA
ncbi:MAG: hypothetical protein HYW51_03620 [Candidatus Doudnabacteria bacterium]|nr:hypothetical protein [Candidatus Doudnabacteria bacterium]